jgi:hypothetical protein
MLLKNTPQGGVFFLKPNYDYALIQETPFVCTANADCVSTSNDVSLLQCVKGVCVKNRQNTNTCYSHADCTGRLCSGAGKCVDPLWQVENDAGFDTELDLYSKSCTGTGVQQLDNFGASPW